MHCKSLVVMAFLTVSILYAPPTTRSQTRAALAAAKKKTEIRACFEEKAKEDEKWALPRILSECLRDLPLEESIIDQVQELRPNLSRGRRDRFLSLGISILKNKCMKFRAKKDKSDQDGHEKLTRVAQYQTLPAEHRPKTREGVRFKGQWVSNYDLTTKISLEPVTIVGQTGAPNFPFTATLRVQSGGHEEQGQVKGETRDMLNLLVGAKVNGKKWQWKNKTS